MSPDTCGECGDDFVWDADAGSAVCLNCGTLQDPSQVVLDSHIEPEHSAKDTDSFSFYHRVTLKSFRNAHGWDLAGQGSQPDIERNKIAMREYISALAHRIGHPSLSGRTLFLFELAMERGRFRYGKRARLVAAACLAIALRENHKGETIRDIAYVINDSHIALARILKSIISLLDIKLDSVDPSWHLPLLQKHLASLLAGKSSILPRHLVKILNGINLPSAFRTAASLSDLVTRAEVTVGLPSPPTACALCIVALEAEASSSLPQLGELARALGRRFEVGKEVVLRRYRIISECVEGWTNEIPWIKDVGSSAGCKSAAKAAKRARIARRLKDAIQYQESLWKTRLQANSPLAAPCTHTEFVSSSEISVSSRVDTGSGDEGFDSKEPRPRKRRRTGIIDKASRFLLSPLYAEPSQRPTIDRVAPLDVTTHILTSEDPSHNQPPTRLQLLAAVKNVDDITDEELFGEGELESFLRTTEEREVLTQACDRARAKTSDDACATGEARVNRAGKGRLERDSASRMNIEALDRLLNGHDLTCWAQNTDKDDDDDDNWASSGFLRQIMTQAGGSEDGKSETSSEGCDDSHRSASLQTDDGGEVLGPWRPLSPSPGGG
ncbi:hypothetical protein ACEPAF_4807 [Sanghuangporus sanghuang]